MMMPEGGMMGGGFGGFGLTWLLNFVIMIVFIAGLVLLVVWFVRQFAGGQRPEREGKTALDILKERYARGEIDRDEFEQKKKDIGA